MKAFKIIYSLKENKIKRKIFVDEFASKYKYKCKIIFNNKSYPLKSDFGYNNKENKDLKIKLICYADIPNISQIFPEIYVGYDYYGRHEGNVVFY